MSSFAQPDSTEQALDLLSNGNWMLLAGGTDFYPALGNTHPAGNVLDLSRLDQLRSIYEDETHWHIGSLSTWTDVIKANLPESFDALKLAAREVGSVQIQNRGTVAGNICNASPAADGIPPLLCLDTIVRTASQAGSRDTPLQDFIVGNRQTTLQPGEMVVDLLIPKSSSIGRSTFTKLGARKYLVISIAMVATRLCVDKQNHIVSAALSIGSCSVRAQRLHSLEQTLTGKQLTTELQDIVQPHHVDDLSPIDDVRATASYRLDAAVELTRRSISDLVRLK